MKVNSVDNFIFGFPKLYDRAVVGGLVRHHGNSGDPHVATNSKRNYKSEHHQNSLKIYILK